MTSVPNYKIGVGRLVTDRYDFQNHIDGYNSNHRASQINLFPTIVIGSVQTNVQGAIAALTAALTVPVMPDATTGSKGAIQLAGDIGGTATSVSVLAIHGYPVASTAPTTNYVLTWNGSSWGPLPVSASFTFAGDVTGTASATTVVKLNGKPIVSTVPNLNDVLFWGGSSWAPVAINAALIQYAGGGSWADSATNPATTVELQLDKVISDLAATTGDVKIGAPLRSGSPTSLSSGSVGSQVITLLTALNSFQNQKGAASGLATLDSSTKVPIVQLYSGVANGIATLDGSIKVPNAQLNLAVANGIATLDGSIKLLSSQRVGWIVEDAQISNDIYGETWNNFTTNSFSDGYLTALTVTLTGLNINDIVMINISAGVWSSTSEGSFKIIANSNGGAFSDVPGTLMVTNNTGSNNPANIVDRWAAASKYVVTANGSVIIKIQGKMSDTGSAYVTGSSSLYCIAYRP